MIVLCGFVLGEIDGEGSAKGRSSWPPWSESVDDPLPSRSFQVYPRSLLAAFLDQNPQFGM